MKIRFPLQGLDKGRATSEQPENTAPNMGNVRPYDSLGNKLRGGQRPGLDKWGTGYQIGSAEQPVVAMCVVSSVA